MARLGLVHYPFICKRGDLAIHVWRGGCAKCVSSGEVEDECHFLFVCTSCDNIGREWEKSLGESCDNLAGVELCEITCRLHRLLRTLFVAFAYRNCSEWPKVGWATLLTVF